MSDSQIRMKPICFIPARGGSKGIKYKNLKKLVGKPLIVHAIDLAKSSKIFQEVVVSTDNSKIAKIAEKAGAVILSRPRKLATNYASMDNVLLDAIPRLAVNFQFETLVNLDCTVPFVTKKDIIGLVNLLERSHCDTTCLVYKQHHNPYFNMVELNSKGYLKISKAKSKRISARQKAPVVYQLIGILALNITRFMKLKKIYMPKTLPYEISYDRGLMIDTKLEFQIAEFIASCRKF